MDRKAAMTPMCRRGPAQVLQPPREANRSPSSVPAPRAQSAVGSAPTTRRVADGARGRSPGPQAKRFTRAGKRLPIHRAVAIEKRQPQDEGRRSRDLVSQDRGETFRKPATGIGTKRGKLMAMTRTTSKARSRKGLATLVGLVAMVAAGGTVMATPAAASTNCASGYHCVFFNSLNSAKHSYFDSDTNFAGDTFNQAGVNGEGSGQAVNDNTWAASNSSTGGYESHYYVNSGYNTFLFCVNPGSEVNSLPTAQRDRASSLQLRGTTSISCY